jgi:phage replication initiation protein
LVDYVRVTLPDMPETWAGLDGWLGERVEREVGWRGWYSRSAHVLDGGIVGWCEDSVQAERQGVLVDLPGKACAALGEGLVTFLGWCVEHGSVRRLDLALDDRAGLVTLDRIKAAEAAGAVVTRARSRPKFVGDVLQRPGEGWTLYYGSRNSEGLVRIYDKAAERAERGGGPRGGGHWVRVELEAKGDYAANLAGAVLEGGGEVVAAQVLRRLRFCEPVAGDSNPRRWPIADWWNAFLGGVEAGESLACGEAQATTVEAMREYLRRQAMPTLAALLEAYGGEVDWLYADLRQARHRVKPKHRAAIVAHERSREAERERERAVPKGGAVR